MSSSTSSPVQPVASNVIGTLTLALCAVGLTAAVYWSNSRGKGTSSSPAMSPGGGRGGGGAKGRRGGEEAGRHGTHNGELPSRGVSPDEVGDGAAGDNAAVRGFRSADSATTAAASIRQALPPRNYFTRCAERHVRRHTASLVEWFDDQLGVHIPFSPILFAVQQEERQAPLVLLSLRYLRQDEHRIAITIEETSQCETAAHYMEASLEKVTDCAQLLSTGTTRIGNTPHPQAEYCYMDEHNALLFTLAIFLTQDRLAITVQYTAPTRVRTIVPTAFHELIRSIRFTAPKVSPSYLLVSEPRLGFGLRLPLDFSISDSLTTAVRQRLQGNRASAGPLAAGVSSGGSHALTAMFQHQTHSSAHGGASLAGLTLSDAVPFLVAAGRGARCMAVLASHEPSGGSASTAPPLSAAASSVASGGVGGGAGGTPQGNARWSWLLERHVHTTMSRLGLRATSTAQGGGVAGSGFVMPRLRLKDDTSPPLDGGRDGAFTVRPYRLVASLGGNFTNVDDDDVASGAGSNGHSPSALALSGSFFVEQTYMTSSGVAALLLQAGATVPDAAVPVFWSCFYLAIGDDCVAVDLIAPCAQYTFQRFVEVSTATVNTISLGNHYGQGTATTYCNLRHELAPFTVKLRIAAHEAVEEPFIGDPLCVVSTWLPRYRVALSVIVRLFPVVRLHGSVSGTTTPSTKSLAAATKGGSTPSKPSGGGRMGGSSSSGPPRRRASTRVLEHMVRNYLNQMPDSLSICEWQRTTVNGLPALRFSYDLGNTTGGLGGPVPGAYGEDSNADAASAVTSEWLSSRALTIEEEVGSMNPLAAYYRPAPPPASYLGLPPATPAGSSDGLASVTAGAGAAEAVNGTQGGALPRRDEAKNASSLVGDEVGSAEDRCCPEAFLDDAQEPIRVGLALYYSSSQAMLFSAGCDGTAWRDASDAVLSLASRFTASPVSDA